MGALAEEAELFGIIKALEAARSYNFLEVVLISDSLNVISALQGEDNQLEWDNKHWLELIQISLQHFSFSKCVYLPRSHIAFADALSSFGRNSDVVNLLMSFNLSSLNCVKSLESVSPCWVAILDQTVCSICNSFIPV